MTLPQLNRKKVLIVLYYYHPYVSGLSIFVKRVAEGLAGRGYEVTVLTSRYDKNLKREEIIQGVRILRRPVLFRLGKGVVMPTLWFEMIYRARRHDYVMPCLPMIEPGLTSLFIPKRKLVTAYVCDIFLGEGLVNKLITAVTFMSMNLQLKRSRVITALSLDYLKHSKMKKFTYKAVGINPPVNESEFSPVDPKSLFDKLGVTAKEIKIGFVGRIVYEKGIQYLLEAIPHLEKQLDDFKIFIAGDYENVAGGSIKNELDQFIANHPSKIVFTGYLNHADLNRFFSGIDVLVLPSIDPLEAFGMVQVEAMLCGTPVVASNLPGVREVVQSSGYGRLSQLKAPADIAEQIVEVVTHPKKYKPVRKQVVQLFNAHDSIDAYARLLPKDETVSH